MKKERNKYLSTLLKKGYLVYALFFTCLAFTLLAFCCETNFFIKLDKAQNWKVFIAVSALTYLAIGMWYCVSSTLKKQVNLSDSLIIAATATSILFLAYRLVYLKSRSVYWAVACLVLALVCIALIAIKNKVINDWSTNTDSFDEPTKVSALNYYKAVFAKYSAFTIVCLSAIELCAMLLFASPTLYTYISYFNLKSNLLTIAICLVLPFVYLISKTASAKACGLDAIILSLFISIPLMFFYVLLTHGISKVMVVWNGLFALVVILSIIRFICFDFSLSSQEETPTNQIAFVNYAVKIKDKYGLLSATALGSLLAVAFSHLFTPGHLYNVLYTIKQFGMISNPAFFPIGLMLALVYSTIALLGLFALVGVKAKKVHLGDFAVVTLGSFSVFSLICLTQTFSYVKLFACTLCLIFDLIILGVRLVKVEK